MSTRCLPSEKPQSLTLWWLVALADCTDFCARLPNVYQHKFQRGLDRGSSRFKSFFVYFGRSPEVSNTSDPTVDEALAQLNTIKPKIQTGSYVGTGLYGESNPNSLTFNFTPKILFIGGGNEGTYVGAFPFIYGASEVVSVHNVISDKMTGLRVTWNEKSVSWFFAYGAINPNPSWVQLNGGNANYFWVAIG